jgi:hypothetical protein
MAYSTAYSMGKWASEWVGVEIGIAMGKNREEPRKVSEWGKRAS